MKRVYLLMAVTVVPIVLALMIGLSGKEHPGVTLIKEPVYKRFSAVAASPLMKMPKRAAWKKAAPQVKAITIMSSADRTPQPALFYDSGSARKKPLLLVLHSWSADYQQQFSIPYGIWAVQNDWVFIHPDYRGAFTNPGATASEAAVQDVLDAVAYAEKHARIDESRIYIAGFSGGAMMTLIMVGRYPELWAGAVAWVPVYDLAEWYRTTRNATHDYSRHIANSCGGPPTAGTKAAEECAKRSPAAYLKNARGRGVPVYIATGIDDTFVPPSHSLRAFNDLAAEEDHIRPSDIAFITRRHKIPPHLPAAPPDRLYADAGVRLLFERESNGAVLKIFKGGHDVIYNAGLSWLSGLRKGASSPDPL